jgi:hypothetical protein
MIEIQDLEGKVKSEIIDLLLEQESNSFEIYIPKSTQLNFSESDAIAIDYNKLAYAGHLLKEISKAFNYEKVAPEFHESVLFNVQTNDIEGLAKALFEISFGYVNDEEVYQDIEEDFEFWMNADQYLSDVNEGKIKDVACPYFCQIAQKFFEEIADEEDI